MAKVFQRTLPWGVLQYAVFLLVVYLQAWLRVRPHLHYEVHPHFPVFYSGSTFLKPFLGYPGGLIEYIAGLFSLSYVHSWSGALVFTTVVGLICWSIDVLILGMTGGRGRLLALVPGLVLFSAFSLNAYHLVPYLALLTAGLGIVVYVGLASGSVARRGLIFAILAPGVYWVAGGAFLVFVMMAILFEYWTKRQRLLALVYLLSMEAVPYLLGLQFAQVSLADAYARALPLHRAIEPTAAEFVAAGYATVLLVTILAGAWRWLTERGTAQPGTPSKLSRERHKPSDSLVRSFGACLAILVATSLVAFFSFEPHVQTVLLIDDLARRQKWNEILQLAPHLPPLYYTTLVNQHVNRALYETGRLPYDMFCFPQSPTGVMVDTTIAGDPETQGRLMLLRTELWFQLGDLDLCMGLVNEAEHEAHEALASHGPHPDILYALARCNIVKRQPQPAYVFLNALNLHPLEGRRARVLLSRLNVDPFLEDDPDIQTVRERMPTVDMAPPPQELEGKCQKLLLANPHNRMAFEYLMAYYLVTRNLDRLAHELWRLEQLSYPDIPRAYQEALVLWEAGDTSRKAECGGRQVSPEVVDTFARFTVAYATAYRTFGHEGARLKLAAEFGNTYYYYHAFGQSGVGQQ